MPRVSLRDARIRTKLAVVLLVPVISTVGLAAARLVDSGQRAADARLSNHLTTLSSRVTALSYSLHHERMAFAQFVADSSVDAATLSAPMAETDAQVGSYREALKALDDPPSTLEAPLHRIDTHLDALADIRKEAQDRKDTTVAQVVLRYSAILADMTSYVTEAAEEIGVGSDLTESARSVAAFAAAQGAAAEQQAVAFVTLSQSGSISEEQQSTFLATLTTQQQAFQDFLRQASAEQWATARTFVTGDAIVLADSAADDVSRSQGTKARIGALDASRAIGAEVDLMRYAQQRLEWQLGDQINALASQVTRQAIIESSLLIAALLLAILMAAYVARMMVRSLERLRGGAMVVAQRSLPETVERLRDARGLDERSADQLASEVRDEIQVRGKDEIGQVAQAFNVVHREAVRIAADQAVLRGTVSAMFLSLARRSQTLVDRMIAELDSIEQHEQDPKRLARMFRLDHLATRMRRNDENLLVLAGADASPARREDAGLEDVLRAAQSEVELYDRIEFSTVDADTAIAAHAVNDVVRMTAELMDNGTRFSPPGTVVVADARRIGDYVLIQVEDRGLGMTDEQLQSVNERLDQPGSVDVSSFRMMGLGVVSRLAHRYGIKAELRRNADSGITAGLVLPRSILVLPRSADNALRQRRHLAIEEPGRHAALPSPPREAPPAPREAPHEPVGFREPGLPTRVPGQRIAGDSAGPPPISVSAVPVSAPSATATQSPPMAAPMTPPMRAADDTAELPIFRQMQATWFGSTTTSPTVPDSWQQPEPARVTARAAVRQETARSDWPSAGAPPAQYRPTHDDLPQETSRPEPSAGRPEPVARLESPTRDVRQSSTQDSWVEPGQESWRTTADTGWRAAAAAAAPDVSSTTKSGLPIRTPQANLVPGSVGEPAPTRVKRTPEQVQGLLSAYTRGVQRGRDDLASPQQSRAQNEDRR
ncbi:MAG: HAMP domain-containing protein [Hamadaea sp.]|uniref:sensor histidine kinase n=1 Tax=Hamadaea sp. TaxID=2024425 RepID=UPI0018548C6A|nr:nitrate- and nitrite sensing domain-containing protein [Hamadaea sp.]NUR71643.1 HAMP domain-containing protein [Hamadaea sp.]NUT20207.1 HAMP domain-containing protein [Hamadaea sp.]